MAALYQRARPVTFDGLVGQEHVKEVLSLAVEGGKTSHAYLFSGPRGVGKTTTARLLAMAVNCEAEPGARPCGVCESCRLVRSVSHPDVIELDAASNNSVDDVRDLQERVGLASMRGGTRVWILDEAHMLSKAAANALLKTLEEPPPGLMFVLATTEPEKLPPTILSRCQHFRFRRLSEAEIVSKLERLSAEAGVEADATALALIARSADGGMRDAESLLERLLVRGERIELSAAEQALGLPPQERLARMGAALVAGQLGPLLDEAADLYRDGYAPRTIAEQLARALRDELHRALAGAPTWLDSKHEALLTLLHALDDESDRFVRQNDLYALEVALIKARNALWPSARPDQSAAVAAAVVPRQVPHEEAAKRTRATTAPAPQPAPTPAPPAEAPTKRPAPEPSDPEAEPTAAAEPTTAAEPVRATETFSWHAVRTAAGPQLKAFLHPAQVAVDGLDLNLTYDERHAFHHAQLIERLSEFEALLASVAGPGFRVRVTGPAKGGKVRSGGRPKAPTPTVAAKQLGAQSSPQSSPQSSAQPSAQRAAAQPAAQPAAKSQPSSDPEPRSESVQAASPQPPESDPSEGEPADLDVSELELAGFSEDESWHDEPPVGSLGTGRETGRSIDSTAAVLAGHEARFEELQQLFPGRLVEVVPDAAAAGPATRAAAAADIEHVADPLHDLDDEREEGEGYDDETQERLAFGPGPAAGES